MKRLYLVGKSRDNRKLYFARSRNAKFGSLEVPISQKLLKLVREAEEARAAKRRPKREVPGEGAETPAVQEGPVDRPPAGQPPPTSPGRAPAPGGPGPRRRAGGLPPGGFQRAIRGEGVGAVIPRRPSSAQPPEPDDLTPPLEPRRAEPPAERPEPQEAEKPPAPPPRPDRRPDARPATRLTPAEIQTLLRAGRGVRSVARQAEAPVDWVRRLAQPIESERVGVVIQLMRAYQSRPRLGRSALAIGPAIVENLRDKGVRFPERVVEEGWAATRPDGRDWRIRFTYESRGRRHRADWTFDPQTGEASPANDAASRLGFRSPRNEDGARPGAAGGERAIRPRSVRAASPSPGAVRGASGKGGSSRRRAGAASGRSGRRS